MVCQKISSSNCAALLLVFSFGFLVDGCDIGDCRSVIQTVFSKLISNNIRSLCGDLKQVSKCLNECHQTFFPYHIDVTTTVSLFEEICDEEFVYDVEDHWACIQNHLNKFFMCVARSSSIKSSYSGSYSGKLISCRKKLMIFDCPEEVFSSHCEEEAVQIVSKKFKAAMKPWLNSSCYGIPQNKVYNLDVNHDLTSDFDSIAGCMDSYSYIAKDCFSEYLEKAVYSEIHCWKGAKMVCNNPTSSIPCSPVSLAANFYTSLFSYGKSDCVKHSTVSVTESDINLNTNGTNSEDYEEPKTSTQSLQPVFSTMDSNHSTYFPETTPPVSIYDLKPNDGNILSLNNTSDITQADEINSSFSPFDSSLNITSSIDLESSIKNTDGVQYMNDKSISSSSQYTYSSAILNMSCMLIVIFFHKI